MILILGLGITGRAAAEYFLGTTTVYALDDKQDIDVQDLIKRGLRLVKEVPDDTALIVRSPGIPDSHPALQKGIPVIGEVELAARRLQSYEWIGITGTNGKTTVTLFLEHLFNKAGRKASALGNVGTPLLTYEPEPNELIVAELSSYQLDLLKTPVLKAATLLNITPDHLDRYEGMAGYAASKVRIFDHMKPGGTVVVNQKTVATFPALFQGRSYVTFGFNEGADIFYDGESLFAFGQKVRALPDTYKGVKTHDSENWMAALGLAKVWGIPEELFWEALETFKKPRHRIEKVGVFKDLHFFDDSKGTNIDATVRAVESMKGPVVLIAGGVHKGFSYRPWKEAFQGKVKALCVIGQASCLIEKDLQDSFTVVRCVSMQEAVEKAVCLAAKDDNVLLSPGCSSLDMFKDYAHRGDEFQRCVHNWVRTNT